MSTNDLSAQIWSDSPFRVRRTVDLLCREFEEHWRDGRRLSIEEFLTNADESLQDDLLPELVATEMGTSTCCQRTSRTGRLCCPISSTCRFADRA